MSSFCQDLRTNYERLQRLTVEFEAKYNAVKETGDLGEVKRADSRTTNRFFDDQQALYAEMVANGTRGLYDSTDLIPTEYIDTASVLPRGPEVTL